MKTTAALVAWLAVFAAAVWAQSNASAPQDVEAAYLYQFGLYVDWPAELINESKTFAICILGVDPLGEALDEIVTGKAITGRQVESKHIARLGEANDCRILFVSSSEDARVPEILKALAGMQVLTVGRGAEFTRRGGMIGFTSENRRVRFVVNLAAADAARLELSSQLLRVAMRVDR